MELWIPVTVAAAAFQTVRFMLQKSLSQVRLSTGGATFARFLVAAPLACLLVWAYLRLSGQAMPVLGGRFWVYALIGGLGQILATACVVALFRRRNFAVGITFKKTEVVQTAIAGVLVLGERVSAGGLAAILVGLLGVLLLSDPPTSDRRGWRRLAYGSAALGLGSGLFFALAAVCYRGGSLQIDSADPLLRAGVTLACVTSAQMIAMAGWLAWREAGQLTAVVRAWRPVAAMGLAGLAGSLCWFTAFTLQNAAYVQALGQVELVFSFLASTFFFNERSTRRELAGIAVLTLSILLLILLR